MKWILLLVLFSMTALTVMAHEHQMIKIGETTYDLTIGNLNEPVYVGDKSGVDLRVNMVDAQGVNTPVTDLVLKVEATADGKSKTFDLKAAWGAPGSYKAEFYPTAATSYTYRITGMIEDTPIDVTATCNAAGHVMDHGAMEHTQKELSPGVTLISHTGAFGCPQSREAVNFPNVPDKNTESAARQLPEEHKQRPDTLVYSTLAIALAALVMSIRNIRRKR